MLHSVLKREWVGIYVKMTLIGGGAVHCSDW